MKRYQTLLFDVDDTLLDFKAAENYALQKLFSEHDIVLTDDIKQFYQDMNQKLWSSFEKGEIKREELLHTRFSILFKKVGLTLNGAHLDNLYRQYLEESAVLIDGAKSLVQKLTKQYNLYVVTNGVARTQFIRLNNSELTTYFKDIFVSEEVGYQKPTKEFFNHVFEKIPHHSANKTLIIGDSLTSDIQGGVNAGIDTCWFNPNGSKNATPIPTYEIHRLQTLENMLLAPNFTQETPNIQSVLTS
ncbi:YjjG family noncanonical pyrimidine nucleotidase [Carnobacterium sp.]|uniref:YjjG family noncanonical pyrimidine nucleotidase n=1 Tax=Carnobacterium sp. TaxID=48221 RepID=UPI00388CF991